MPNTLSDIEDVLWKQQVHDVIAEANSRRDTLLMRTLWVTGMRISNALKFAPSWVDWDRHVITVLSGKTENAMRRISVPEQYIDELDDYTSSNRLGYGSDTPYFNFSRQRAHQIVKQAGRRAGMGEKVHPHIFRHSHLSHAVQGVDNFLQLLMLSKQAGHNDVQMTAEYLHFKDSAKKGMLEGLQWYEQRKNEN